MLGTPRFMNELLIVFSFINNRPCFGPFSEITVQHSTVQNRKIQNIFWASFEETIFRALCPHNLESDCPFLNTIVTF